MIKGFLYKLIILFLSKSVSAQHIDTASVIVGTGTSGYFYSDVLGGRLRSLRFEPYILKQLKKDLYAGLSGEYQFVRSNFLELDDMWGFGIKSRYYLPVLKKEQDRMRVAAELGYYLTNSVGDASQETSIRVLDCMCADVLRVELIANFRIWKGFYLNAGLRREIAFEYPDFFGAKLELEYQITRKNKK